MEWTHASEFEVSTTQVTIASGASQTITVIFFPTSPGNQVGKPPDRSQRGGSHDRSHVAAFSAFLPRRFLLDYQKSRV